MINQKGVRSTSTTEPPLFEVISCNICGTNSQTAQKIGLLNDPFLRFFSISRSQWVICNQCSLVFQNPRPNYQAWAKLYVNSVYRDIAGSVDNPGTHSYSYVQFKKMEKWFTRATGTSIGTSFPRRFLDFGCGIGGTLKYFQDKGCEKTAGIEVDDRCVAEGRKHFGVDISADFEADNIRDQSFDLIFTHHCLEHLLDINHFFENVSRRLDQNGFLAIVLPSYWKAKARDGYGTVVSHNFIVTHHTLKYYFRKHGLDYVAHRYAHLPGSDHEIWCVAKKSLEKPRNSPLLKYDRAIVARSLFVLRYLVPLRIALFWIPENLSVHFSPRARFALRFLLKGLLPQRAFEIMITHKRRLL